MGDPTPRKKKPADGISFIVPAHNEQNAIANTLVRLHDTLKSIGHPYEILVVDDASRDDTIAAVQKTKLAYLIHHPSNGGYGHALKSGIANAKYDWIGIVDADGTYEIEIIPELVDAMEEGFDMAIAQRQNISETDTRLKGSFRRLYIGSIELLLDRKVPDPNSGLRLFTKDLVTSFLPFLCNSFSFTTSLTVFALGGAHFVKFVPSRYEDRVGKSKVRHFRDSLRTIQLIVQGVTFYNPVKLYLLLAFVHLILVGMPSFFLTLFSPPVGIIYLIAGSFPFLFVAIGAVADIFRVSTLRRENVAEVYGGKPIALKISPKGDADG